MSVYRPLLLVKIVAIGMALFWLAACSDSAGQQQACSNRNLNVGFYAFFPPVSYSADADPASEGFNTHLGYESDLLTALEAVEGRGLSFSRRGFEQWNDIWLLSAAPEYDLIGGGITILDSRTKDSSGEQTDQLHVRSRHLSPVASRTERRRGALG